MLIRKKLNILKFNGDNFYIEDKSHIVFDTKYKSVDTKLHINAKKSINKYIKIVSK